MNWMQKMSRIRRREPDRRKWEGEAPAEPRLLAFQYLPNAAGASSLSKGGQGGSSIWSIFKFSLVALIAIVLPIQTFAADDDVFLFSFFKDNGQAGVFLASSDDGYTFTTLNDDKPIMKPPKWENQMLTRDPSIVYHDGMFRMVWTSNWEGTCFGAASSKDLKTWSMPIQVQTFTKWPKSDFPRNTWAPEVHWNPVGNFFFILWSSATKGMETEDMLKLNGHNSGGLENDASRNVRLDPRHHRTFISRTTDFQTFSDAAVFFAPGKSEIDACMALDDRETANTSDDRWILVVKDEQDKALNGKNLRLAYTKDAALKTIPPKFMSLTDPSKPWTEPVVGNGAPLQGNYRVEGAMILKANGEWRIYFDRYDLRTGRYGLIVSKDLQHWTDNTDKVSIPDEAHHGTIFRAPRSAVAFLK